MINQDGTIKISSSSKDGMQTRRCYRRYTMNINMVIAEDHIITPTTVIYQARVRAPKFAPPGDPWQTEKLSNAKLRASSVWRSGYLPDRYLTSLHLGWSPAKGRYSRAKKPSSSLEINDKETGGTGHGYAQPHQPGTDEDHGSI